jgi:hypothetical protein
LVTIYSAIDGSHQNEGTTWGLSVRVRVTHDNRIHRWPTPIIYPTIRRCNFQRAFIFRPQRITDGPQFGWDVWGNRPVVVPIQIPVTNFVIISERHRHYHFWLRRWCKKGDAGWQGSVDHIGKNNVIGFRGCKINAEVAGWKPYPRCVFTPYLGKEWGERTFESVDLPAFFRKERIYIVWHPMENELGTYECKWFYCEFSGLWITSVDCPGQKWYTGHTMQFHKNTVVKWESRSFSSTSVHGIKSIHHRNC